MHTQIDTTRERRQGREVGRESTGERDRERQRDRERERRERECRRMAHLVELSAIRAELLLLRRKRLIGLV